MRAAPIAVPLELACGGSAVSGVGLRFVHGAMNLLRDRLLQRRRRRRGIPRHEAAADSTFVDVRVHNAGSEGRGGSSAPGDRSAGRCPPDEGAVLGRRRTGAASAVGRSTRGAARRFASAPGRRPDAAALRWSAGAVAARAVVPTALLVVSPSFDSLFVRRGPSSALVSFIFQARLSRSILCARRGFIEPLGPPAMTAQRGSRPRARWG